MSFLLAGLLGAAAVPLGAIENPTIKDTDYPIPAGALFVATTGDDGNPGTEADPFRTVERALGAAPDGGTIVIRAGTYREGGFVVSRPLTLQPYPHEEVWLKGSVEVSGWVPDGPNWRVDGWIYEFDQDTYDPGAFDPAYLHAGKPDMVFVDGLPLRQVGDPSEMAGDTFYVDYGQDRLYIGTDPAGKTIEAAAHGQALRAVTPSADGAVVRGLGFMHYAGHRFEGSLQADDARVTFENNTVAWGASKGMTVYNSTGTVIAGNTLVNNGQMGLGGWRTQGMQLLGNRLAANNQEHFVMHGGVAEASGAKITDSTELVIRDNEVDDNLATGLWLDISVYDCVIAGNLCRNNSSFGIFYEISASGIIAGNVLASNLDAGIAVSNASDVQVYNNTLVDNSSSVAVFDDSRVNGDPTEIALGITYITSDVVVKNNILSNTDGSGEHVFARDYNSDPLKDADDMYGASDFNAYHRTDRSSPADMIEWWRGTSRSDYATLAEFRSATGLEANGLAIDDIATSPFFVDEAGGDYHLTASSVARDAGEPLPADVAAALGLDPAVVVDLGALQFDGGPAPPADVPNGRNATQPVLAVRGDATASVVLVYWDGSCAAANTNLLYGSMAEVATAGLDGSSCAIANPETWSSAAGSVWFVLVGDDGAGVESSWGRPSAGASGECGNTTRDDSTLCQ